MPPNIEIICFFLLCGPYLNNMKKLAVYFVIDLHIKIN